MEHVSTSLEGSAENYGDNMIDAWSKSSLQSLLEGCPWQWYLTKIAGLRDNGSPATVRGTAFHAAVEHHERRRLLLVRDGQGSVPSRDECMSVASMALDAELNLLPDGMLELHEQTSESVHRSLENLIDNWWSAPLDSEQDAYCRSLRERLVDMRPVAVEYYFNAPLKGHRPVHGVIDMVLWDEEARQWVVVDHKTASSFGRWDLSGAGHETEAAVYGYGAMRSAGLPVSGESVRMEWHVVRPVSARKGSTPSRLVRVNVTEGRAEGWVESRVSAAEQALEENNFPTRPDWNLCSVKWCAFYEGCQGTGELSPSGFLPPAQD
jgi:hypothetical protein